MRKALARIVAMTAMAALLLAGASPANAATLRERVEKLEKQVAALKKKTRLLHKTYGYYMGFVHGSQVFMSSEYDNCAPGNAVWIADPDFPGDEMLWCGSTTTASLDAQTGNTNDDSLHEVMVRRGSRL